MITAMVVDDSAFTRRMMRQELEKLGYAVIEAPGGRRALELYAEQNPDFVTLDLLMPGMEGDEVLSRLKDIDPEVKVIVCTSNVQSSMRSRLMQLGALGVVNKPVRMHELLTHITAAVPEA